MISYGFISLNFIVKNIYIIYLKNIKFVKLQCQPNDNELNRQHMQCDLKCKKCTAQLKTTSKCY